MSYNYNLGLSFYEVAAATPDAVALKYPNEDNVSYDTLNRLSNRIANYFAEKGLRKGQVVAIFNDKTPYGYASMLACLKLGLIYTNLDITSPWNRLEKILFNSSPAVVCMDIDNEELSAKVSALLKDVYIVRLADEAFRSGLVRQPDGNLAATSQVTGADAAYIMFTSGSTGFPKGAVMSHQNILNFIGWGKKTFEVTSSDIFTNANPIYFDNSVFDFYISIFNNATLVPLSHNLVKQPKLLIDAINASGCTIWFSVPSLLVYLLTTRSLTSDDFPSVSRISFGGEGFPKNKLKQLFDMFGKRAKLFNVYGPTECTCICSSYIISETDFSNMNELAPLGFLSPNFDYEILPLDQINPKLGELCLKGPCVGLGYYNDPERTQKSFIQSSANKYTHVMYKTGDLVEEASNGYLYFRGRIDNQIKHMGYRIELEEIEAAFNTLSYIDEVGVIYQKLNVELGQIVACISVNNPQINVDEILNDIKTMLPPYMVPRIIRILPLLPKNQNGKIDRKQLKDL